MENFKSTHNLTFYQAPYEMDAVYHFLCPHLKFDSTDIYLKYKIGTCHGLYQCSERCYKILAVFNDEPGNGHFDDVMEFFENSAKRDGYAILIQEIWNKQFQKHLIEKRGFKKLKKKGCIKYFHK